MSSIFRCAIWPPCTALEQGRWRTAKNPKAYIKTVAKREAIKSGLIDRPAKPDKSFAGSVSDLPTPTDSNGAAMSYQNKIDLLGFKYSSGATTKVGGVWRGGGGGFWTEDPDEYFEADDDRKFMTRQERLVSRLPPHLTRTEEYSADMKSLIEIMNMGDGDHYISPEPRVVPDWDKIAIAAGLDEGERFVLRCRMDGISREKAVDMQDSEDKRREVEAAWRRFNRNIGKIRAICDGSQDAGMR